MKKIFAIAALFAATVAGTAIAADQYDFKAEAPSSAKAGEKAEAKVSVKAKGEWKINKDYPTKLVLEETDGLKFEKTKLTKAEASSFDEHEAVFKVGFTAAAAGKKEIKGTLKFASCDKAGTSCIPKEEKVAISVEVK